MTLHRPVSTNEKLYLSGARYFSELTMHGVIEGSGSLEVEALQAAVDQASLRLPGARLRLDGVQWIADAKAPRVEVLSKYPSIRGDISDLTHDFLPLSPELGQTLSVQFSRSESRTILVFRALHAVMDGKGMQTWIKMIFSFLRGEDSSWVDSLVTDAQILAELPRQKRKNESFFPHASGPKTQNIKEAFQFVYGQRTLRGTVTGIVAKLAKGVDLTLAPGHGGKSLIMVPVDMRNDISAEQANSTANLSLPLLVPVSKELSWSQLSERMLSDLSAKAHLAGGAWDSLYRRLPSALFAWCFKKFWLRSLTSGKYLSSAVVSHTGKQDLAEFSCPAFAAERIIFLPSVVPIAPLGIVISETATSTELTLVCPKALWTEPTNLLDQVLENSGIGSSVVREEEHKQAAVAKGLESSDLCLHQLFERAVERHSDSVALVFEGETLSYRQLNSRANRLARFLLKRGLQKGDFVGVGLERSFDLIAAILGIIKAGGVYVPLDPALPSARLDYMVKDCEAKLVLTTTRQQSKFQGELVILVDEREAEIGGFDDSNTAVPIISEDLCYMIYTSGSTGNPKGALNQHRGIVNHFRFMAREYGLNESDGTLQKTPIGFDASLLEIFLPLQSGCRVIIAKPDGHKDTRYLLQLIREHKLTFLSIVPSVFNHFLDEIDVQEESSLKLVLLGGEEFSRKLFEKFKQRFPFARAVNLYGPAEAAVDTLTFDCRQNMSGRSVPIGKPLANTEVFIVDENLALVQSGEVGELILAGIQIGPGYHNRAELSAEKFIKHPFQPDSPYSAYRTGDLVRELTDGNLEFVGRLDHQVKIRGVRIELGEIEHKLELITGIERAVVVVKSVKEEKLLVAFYVGDTSLDLREELSKSLAENSIPQKFVRLEQLPLNANGKVDRNALPEVLVEVESEDLFVPKDEVEKKVADLWSTLLKSAVGNRTHFFESGGNSLLAISLVVRLNGALKIKINPQDIIENPRFDSFLSRVKILSEGGGQ